jgi:hypothetical protein
VACNASSFENCSRHWFHGGYYKHDPERNKYNLSMPVTKNTPRPAGHELPPDGIAETPECDHTGMLVFCSTENYYLGNGIFIFMTKNPFSCRSFNWLKGRTVKIDGIIWQVVGVESFKPMIVSAGMPIGLAVRTPEENCEENCNAV